jgi:hypothetical protein
MMGVGRGVEADPFDGNGPSNSYEWGPGQCDTKEIFSYIGQT